jgi:ATP-binding cassette subfamily B protein
MDHYGFTPDKLPKNLRQFILFALSPYKLYVGIYIVLATILGVQLLLPPYFTKLVIDALEKSAPSVDINSVVWPVALLVLNEKAIYLIWSGLNYVNLKAQPLIKNKVLTDIFEYTHHHSRTFFQNNLAGYIANNMTLLADNLEQIMYETAIYIIRGIVFLLVMLWTVYHVNPLFAYGLSIWAVVYSAICLIFSKKVLQLAGVYAQRSSEVAGVLVDSVAQSDNVRIFTNLREEGRVLKKSLTTLMQAFRRKEWFIIKFTLARGVSVVIMLAGVLYLLIDLRHQGLVTLGDFAFILGVVINIADQMWWVWEEIDRTIVALGKCKNSLTILLAPIEIKDDPAAPSLAVTEGRIVFDHVVFRYPGSELAFVHEFLEIKPRQKVGLVGYSGGGKSTFVNLILRLHEVNSGKIMIDDQNIRHVSQESLHNAISLIPQDPSLFNRSLLENIRYGCLNATEAEVYEAAEKAHIHDFIMSLPQGYQSIAGDRGVKLSGGQRQRIAVARAILRSSRILIMDEATSSLDLVTEYQVQDALSDFMQDKTAIIIAHRLSTLRAVDRILVFDCGKVVADGTHHDLIEKPGIYRQLWETQVNGFLADS